MMEEPQDSYKLVENRDAMDLVPTWEFEMWWFIALGAGVLVVALFVVFLWKMKPKDHPSKERELAYREALKALSEMNAGNPKETAIQVSLIVRSYLAKYLEEPALYETHEEFVSRHDALAKLPTDTRSETREFFSQLAELKYGPDQVGATEPESLRQKAIELLERIHAS
jgi:hypothetical protein